MSHDEGFLLHDISSVARSFCVEHDDVWHPLAVDKVTRTAKINSNVFFIVPPLYAWVTIILETCASFKENQTIWFRLTQ
jgi:hypothetical protein